jgi:3'-phosphoadenosine 5'-phosphosulfate sulfotransferase (PAPS reductase)/FAD synthetase
MISEVKICSVSGGKDSTALYCLMVEYYGQNFLPVFADTGNEHPVTVNYVRNLHIMAGGPEVKIVKADFSAKLAKKGLVSTGNPFLDMMLWKAMPPSTHRQFCTEWIKLWPIICFLENDYSNDEWIMFTGLRAGESLRRSTRQPFEYNTYFDCEAVNPIIYLSEQEVFAYLEEKGVPPNPLYALGYSRVGCYPCIHSNKGELALLPDWAWDKLTFWEQECQQILGKPGFRWFAHDAVPVTSRTEAFTNINTVREWCKTTRGGKQYDLFKSILTADAPSCMSTWGVCE